MSGQGTSDGGRDIEDTWRQPWWIALGAVVTLGIAWAVTDFWITPFGRDFPDDCVRGPRGGCVTNSFEIHWVPGIAFVVLLLPAFAVTVMGLVTDRWPPALGLAVGTVAGGIYTLVQGQSTGHSVFAMVLFVLAATALSLTGLRKLRSPRRRSQGDRFRH
ncbi:hypothetical protein ACIRSU_05280 [Streptomyces sp. NPDC101160]|uniref:hypothetical protein n=1 Tax=Streptomyces sp. NPDC101160 TaxID=3366118 RepID=UPI003827B2B0